MITIYKCKYCKFFSLWNSRVKQHIAVKHHNRLKAKKTQ